MSENNKYDVTSMPLTPRHYWIVFVASLGQLIGTTVATIAGIIIPMINILSRPELSSFMQGLIGAADLIGIMVGSVLFGRLSDRYGYLLFFRLCPLLVLVAALVSVFVPDIWVLVVCLFIIGIGIGGEYSLDSNYVSELMPVKWRRVMLGVTKAASALGNIIGAALALWWVMSDKNSAIWPELMLIIAGIALLMLLSRIKFYESPKWLLDHGQVAKAEKAVHEFLGADVYLSTSSPQSDSAGEDVAHQGSVEHATSESGQKSMGSLAFMRKYFSQVMLSAAPWACEGLGVYGIGVFIPMLVMALGIEHVSDHMLPILHVAESIKTTLWISCIILPGFLIGVWLTNKRINIPRLQSLGFWACAVTLVLLLVSYHWHWAKWISLISFMLFELFLNIGPHLVTYLLPPMIYPVEVRGQGTGIAAAIGKLGAVLAVFLIPILLKLGGAVLVLGVSAVIMAIGAIITRYYGAKVLPTK
ncbi:MAG: MFS transporter [Muribaculaceae bacterium]|nr:MFS transporter [Muribaculaceae bacterium]